MGKFAFFAHILIDDAYAATERMTALAQYQLSSISNLTVQQLSMPTFMPHMIVMTLLETFECMH